VENFISRHDTLEDFHKTLKISYLYAKSVTLLPTHWPETNAIMQRNRRIGCSVSGLAHFAESRGWTDLRSWLDSGYDYIQMLDNKYSEWLGCRSSIKTTSIKPSGTVSLLFGVTPGVHWPTADVYIRRMRLASNDPLIEALSEAGYHTEPDVMDPKHSVVVEMPTKGPDVRTEREVSMWEKAQLAILAQRYWADNQVSVTITFKSDEKDQIGPLLSSIDGQLKSVSMLPLLEVGGAYAQMPYEKIEEDEWDSKVRGVKRINWTEYYKGKALDAEGEKFCSNDTCEI
jgi:ribonucleoside-triphosphate reductase